MTHSISLTTALLIFCILLLLALHLRLSRMRHAFIRSVSVSDRDPGAIQILPLQPRKGDPAPGILIHILNPLEVAENESTFGRVLGKLSPSLISRQVYLKTAESIGHEFRQRGIRARIEVTYKESD